MLLMLLLLPFCSAAIFQLPAKSTGSLRAKLIQAGTYQEFLITQHAARLDTASQPISDYSDEVYLGNFTVGTPPQPVSLVLDTGSANMWVIDASCDNMFCNGWIGSNYTRQKFDTSKSSSFSRENRKFSIQYGKGLCSGYLGTDTVGLGGGLTIRKQELGIANKLDVDFAVQPMDGIFGLAWPALAVDQITPPMQNLIPQLDALMFSIWLDRKIQGSHGGSAGMITYGGVDTKNCDAGVTYVPLTAKTYWQFKMDGFAVGSYSQYGYNQVISDTGSSWISAPYAMINDIATQTHATWDEMNEIYTVKCSTMKTQPDLVFNIGGALFPVKSVEYILDIGLDEGKCALAISPLMASGFGPSWILGDVFIRQYCNIYDIGNARIGFANAHHNF